MANVLLYFTHPNPGSLNGAAADKIEQIAKDNGHDVRRKNLYELDFNPVLGPKDFSAWQNQSVPDDVKAEQEDIKWAERLVFVYPVWWNERPALLKGYLDRVLTFGFAYAMDDKGLHKLLDGKTAMVAITYGSPDGLYDGLTIDQKYITDNMNKGTMNFCGITVKETVETFGVLAEENKPEQHLKDVAAAAERYLA